MKLIFASNESIFLAITISITDEIDTETIVCEIH